MPNYKIPNDPSPHFLDSADFKHLLPAGFVVIDDIEAQTMLDALTPALTANEVILKQIADLEATITSRRLRELMLGTDNGWLKDVDAQIAALRKKLA